jgi:hypothetical protein
MYKAKEVAAAVLLISGEQMHYTDITEICIESDLSGLGKLGGKTPADTLKARLSTDKKMFSGGSGDGYYGLADPESMENDWRCGRIVADLLNSGAIPKSMSIRHQRKLHGE